MSKLPLQQKTTKRVFLRGFFKNPFFYSQKKNGRGMLYFGLISSVLLVCIFFGSNALATLGYFKATSASLNPFFKNNQDQKSSDLFFDKNEVLSLETPDLKIVQGDFIYGIATPRILTTQTLGNMFGEGEQERKEVIDHTVGPNETVADLAAQYGVTPETILSANNLSKGATLKVGDNVAILPFSGVSYVVKKGDTLSEIVKNHSDKTHQPNLEIVMNDNSLSDEGSLSIGEVLLLRDAVNLPKVTPGPILVNLPSTSLMSPLLLATITQGLHYYNGVDLAANCGEPVYASAAGKVLKAVFNNGYNRGMGNHVTVLMDNGVVYYNGHLQHVFVKPGDEVFAGDKIGLVGKTGKTTGCHDHFAVIGAINPFSVYKVGTILNNTGK